MEAGPPHRRSQGADDTAKRAQPCAGHAHKPPHPNVVPTGRLLPPRERKTRIGLTEILLLPYHLLLSLFERR